MKAIVVSCVLSFVLAGCFAYAPKVEPVGTQRVKGVGDQEVTCLAADEAEGLCRFKVDSKASDAARIYYALPRSMVVVEVPLVRRTLQKPVIGDPIPDCSEKPVTDRMDPGNACYWNFKKAKIDDSAALMVCGVEKVDASGKPDPAGDSTIAKEAVFSTKAGAKASVVSVPDPSQIYAMSLEPGLFEKLKAELELSANGAPARFAATSTSMAKEVVDTVLPIVTGMLSVRKQVDFPGLSGVTGATAHLTVSDFNQVLAELAKLEGLRLWMLQQPQTTAAVLDGIVAQQARLRRLIEGGVAEEEFTIKLAFDPANNEAYMLGTGVAPILMAKGTLCTDVDTRAVLDLTPSPNSLAFVATQRIESGLAESKGFRYRVPLSVTAGLKFDRACDSKMDKDCSSSAMTAGKSLPLDGSFAIAQWGVVRHLPRRIGFGSGALSATLDPQTGAIKLVSNEASGAGRDVAIATLAEASKDHKTEALKQETAELELRLKLCKLRADMGLSLPSECPTAVN